MEPLFRHIDRFARLSNEDKACLSAALLKREVKRKEYLLREGGYCKANYFIVNGCFRMYFVDGKGVDQIVQFGIDNWWITDYVSYGTGRPSQFHIQAVEAATVIVWDQHEEERLFREVPVMERYFRQVLQRTVAAAQQRARYFSDFSGEERYRHFFNAFPEFVQRVPQYMLASYLGFTPEFLSKIRAGKT